MAVILRHASPMLPRSGNHDHHCADLGHSKPASKRNICEAAGVGPAKATKRDNSQYDLGQYDHGQYRDDRYDEHDHGEYDDAGIARSEYRQAIRDAKRRLQPAVRQWDDAESNPPAGMAKLKSADQRNLEIIYNMLDSSRCTHAAILRLVAEKACAANKALATATYDSEAKSTDYLKIRCLRLEQLGFNDKTMVTLAVFLWTFFYSVEHENELLWPGGSLEDMFDCDAGCKTFALQRRPIPSFRSWASVELG